MAIGLALLLLALMTGLQPVIQFDSFYYLECAANIAAGRGPLVSDFQDRQSVITHWPPLYPAAIAGVHLLTGLSIESAALAVNMASLTATMLLMGIWLRRAGMSAQGATLALGILAVQPDFLMKHATAYTEALFLPFLLGSILLADRYREKGAWTSLLAGGPVAGAAIMTRYAGLALIPFAGLLWLGPPREWRARWANATRSLFVWTLLSLLPLMVWKMMSGTDRDVRQLSWHPIAWHHWRGVLETLSRWFFTPLTPWPLGIAALAILIFALRKRLDFAAMWQPRVCAGPLFVAAYGGFLLVSISVADFLTPLDTRILLPCFVTLFPSAVMAFRQPMLDELQGRMAKRLAPLAALLALFWAAQTGYVIIKDRQQGRSYGMQQRRSTIMPGLCAADPGRILYTNVPGFIRHYCKRPALGLPRPVDETSLLPNPGFEQEWQRMETDMRDRGALLAYWTFRQPLAHELNLEAVRQRFPLEKVAEDDTGVVLKWKGRE